MFGRSFSIGALSEIGKVKKSNQDKILVKVGEDTGGDFGLFVVADGMGGLAAGDKASEMIVDELSIWWDTEFSALFTEHDCEMYRRIDIELRKKVLTINQKIFNFGNTIKDRVGSTLSMLILYKNNFWVKHIGDSRVYLLGNRLVQITEDHSWIAQEVNEGRISKEEAFNHPKRNILTRCMGVHEDIMLFETMGKVQRDDAFLLCSDGFYNHISEKEIFEAINLYRGRKDRDIQEVVGSLMEKVNIRGASDNVSVIVICQNYTTHKFQLFDYKAALDKVTKKFGRR